MIVFSLQIVNQLQSRNFQIIPHIPSLKSNHSDERQVNFYFHLDFSSLSLKLYQLREKHFSVFCCVLFLLHLITIQRETGYNGDFYGV